MQPSYGGRRSLKGGSGSSKRGAGSQSKEDEILRDAGLGGIGTRAARNIVLFRSIEKASVSARSTEETSKLGDEHSQKIRPRKGQLNEILLGKSEQQAGRPESPDSKAVHDKTTYVLRRAEEKRSDHHHRTLDGSEVEEVCRTFEAA